jgi:hypothetical protein
VCGSAIVPKSHGFARYHDKIILMMNIKKHFPDENSLKEHIKNNLDTYIGEIEEKGGYLKYELKSAQKASLLGILMFFLCFIPLFVISIIIKNDILNPVLSQILMVIAFLLTMIAIFKIVKRIIAASAVISDFDNKLNKIVLPIIFNIFDLSLLPNSTENTSTRTPYDNYLKSLSEARSEVDSSELITRSYNNFITDDKYTVKIDEKILCIRELNVQNVTGSSKDRRIEIIFKGYFVSFEVTENFTGKTFISTEGDVFGFSNQTLINTFSKDKLKETQLEWNDFEKLLRVTTTDEVEARYILSPNLMHTLYEWWQTKKEKIRISFINNKMYVLFPNNNLRIGLTVTSLDRLAIQEYFESIALPLLHVLHLIETIHKDRSLS